MVHFSTNSMESEWKTTSIEKNIIVKNKVIRSNSLLIDCQWQVKKVVVYQFKKEDVTNYFNQHNINVFDAQKN